MGVKTTVDLVPWIFALAASLWAGPPSALDGHDLPQSVAEEAPADLSPPARALETQDLPSMLRAYVF